MRAALGYYPGCSGTGTSIEYDTSCRAICSAFGITLQEIPDWTCCGSTPAHTIDHVLAGALASRNLAQAESLDISNIATPCPSCLKNLRDAIRYMENPVMKARIDTLTERTLTKKHHVRSILQVLIEDVGLEEIKKKVVQPLKGLKLVTYYGCLLTRPSKEACFDNPENPMSMDTILEVLGATVLPFPLKVDCCGASFAIPERTVVPVLGGKLLELATSLGADAIAVACPLCQMNLDLRQGQINKKNKTDSNLPIPYFTQLMAYALGLDEKVQGFSKLAVNIQPLLDKINFTEKQEFIATAEEKS